MSEYSFPEDILTEGVVHTGQEPPRFDAVGGDFRRSPALYEVHKRVDFRTGVCQKSHSVTQNEVQEL